MYVYVDILFVVNLIMNSIILLLTAWVARVPYVRWRLVLASLAGSVYVIAGVLPQLNFIYTVPGKFIASVIIVSLAFKYKSLGMQALLVIVFYIISFVLGGAVVGWLFFLESGKLFIDVKELGQYGKISWEVLTGGSLLCATMLYLVIRIILKRMLCQRTLYQAEVIYNNKSVVLNAMLDTGNGLYTIIGRKPVVLVNQLTLEKILNECVADYLRKNSPEEWFEKLEACNDENWLSRVQIIPYQSVGSSSMLLGFRPDCIKVKTDKGNIETSDVVLGIYHGALSNNGMYEALLHPAVVNM